MQKLERKEGFYESVRNSDGKNITFFKYGPKKNDLNSLPENLRIKRSSFFFQYSNPLQQRMLRDRLFSSDVAKKKKKIVPTKHERRTFVIGQFVTAGFNCAFSA